MLSIKPLSVDDLPFLLEVRNGCRHLLHDDRHFSLDEARTWFEKEKPRFFLISESEAPVGYFRTALWDDANRHVQIGCDLHPDYRGKGIARGAYTAFMQDLFNREGMNKVWLEVLGNNDRALRLYRRLGFVEEGVKRQHVKRNGAYLDSIVMSMTADEFAARYAGDKADTVERVFDDTTSGTTVPLFKVFMAPSVGDAVRDVLYSGYVGQGPRVAAFEAELPGYLGSDSVVTVNSGTSALHLAYHIALDGVRDGEIISTAMTCSATNTPIVNNGARIVWADVDPVSGNIDPDEIEGLITSRTRAIVMVHWGGNPCEIDRVNDIGRRHGVPVIEDAAHALGATYAGTPVGSHSDFVAFSFQAIKHVTAVDGGCLVCKRPEDRERARLLRWYGIDREARDAGDLRCELDVHEAGYKFHMNDVNAVIGMENFRHLPRLVGRHRDNAAFYDAAFRGHATIRVAPENPRGRSAYWLYTIHVDNRDELMAKLHAEGIGASKVHAPNHTHSAFAAFNRPLPSTERFARTHLCIPVGWWLTAAERARIAAAVIKYAA
jgi:dTDP-4-amino-4,6-dideoxygalactose transaminase/RimJ/RimL family protein N-acetyltransferase